jgi:DegV family protein with EDD domain
MTTKCNLIIDSCCDLPPQLVNVPGVTLLKFPYLMNGAECFDDLFLTGSAQNFYEQMRNGAMPSTAQIPYLAIKEAWRAAAESGVPTVYLCFSSALSGTYNTVLTLMEETREEFPEAELYTVDTALGSIAEGFLVNEALRQRNLGLSAANLAKWANEAKYYVRCVFMVDDLEALRRGGRIPAAVANLGAKLDVKPLLSFDLDGSLSMVGIARGRKKGMKAMVEQFEKEADTTADVQTLTMGHADCPKDFEKLCDMVRKTKNEVAIIECNIGPVIGCHVGPNMLALVYWGADRREELNLADRIAKKVKGN